MTLRMRVRAFVVMCGVAASPIGGATAGGLPGGSDSLIGGSFGDGTFSLKAGTAGTTVLSGTVSGLGGPSPGTAALAAPYSNPSPLFGGNLALDSRLADGVKVGATGNLGSNGRLLDKFTAIGTLSTQRQAPWNAWMSVLGGLGATAEGDPAAALSHPFGGTAVGIDYRIDPRVRVGVAADCSVGNRPVDGFGGADWTEATSLAAYGSFTAGNFKADAIAGYGSFGNGLLRQVSFSGLAPRSADGTTMPHDTAALGFQAKTTIIGSSQAYFRYNGEVGDGIESHALSVGLRLSW